MDGILVAHKPPGPTSHDIVALVRRLAVTKRVGHGGTLDPFASGVLPLFLGRATKVVEYHLGDGKRYRATVCFGASSTTADLEGDLTPADGAPPTRNAVEGALAGFLGEIAQRPPAFSAIKVAGRRAYAMARAGEAVELAERRVTIEGLELLEWNDADADRPTATIDVRCSAGTYVRALARDLGVALGVGGHLTALRRTRVGPFGLDVARTLEQAAEDLGIVPLDAAVAAAFPRRDLTAEEAVALSYGKKLEPSGTDATLGAFSPEGRCIALLEDRDGVARPTVVFAPAGP